MPHPDLDWSLLQSFLMVARSGSLSAAARAQGTSQPTLGRHIRALETELEQPLFIRTPTGQRLTPLGHQLFNHACTMEDAAAKFSLTAAGASARLEGTVRITASRVVSYWHLPPILARLRAQEPGIQIELVASDTPENLMYRDADIAIRMFRPERGDLIARKVTDLALGLYAAKTYLERTGRPERPEDLMKMDFVGFDDSDLILRMMARSGFPVTRDFFGLRCDDQLVHWALVCSGAGIGGYQQSVADRDDRVERVAPYIDLPALPVWLVVPETLRHVPRIARVYAALSESLSRIGKD